MSFKSIFTGVLLFTVFQVAQAQATTCLTGGCHQVLLSKRYVHGPVAAEQMGAKGCVACHVPAGKACSKSKGGIFKPLKSAIQMCKICHASGTGTQHSMKKIDCLRCHDPHGSSSSAALSR